MTIKRYPGFSDLLTTNKLLREKALSEFESIVLVVETTSVDSLDDVRGEIEECDRTWFSYPTYGIVRALEDEELLTKFAIDKGTGISVDLPTVLLAELGVIVLADSDYNDPNINHGVLERYVGPGDRILWQGRTFELKTLDKDIKTYWANTEYPLFFSGIGSLYRERSAKLMDL